MHPRGRTLQAAGRERQGAVAPACALLGLLLLAPPAAAAESFKVIVNASNTVDGMSSDAVSGLFLKKKERWDSGSRVSPVDLPAASPCREAFSVGVHGKDVEAIKKYWRKLVFSGLGEAPQELASETAVIDFVARNVGAVGYVCGDVGGAARVRVLKVSGGGK